MNYKKIIQNQNIRFKILSILSFIPDSIMIKIQYFIKLSKFLNLSNPKRFTEKLQWYKLYYQHPLLTKCSDKFKVRDYVKSKGLEKILNINYGVYNSFNEIPFEKLPEKFAIKSTNGSGTNLFCKIKSKFNTNYVVEEIEKWLNKDMYILGREWCYKNIKPRIIIEELLVDTNNIFDGVNDYKFICFNGKAKYIVLDVDREVSHKRNFYDLDWNYIDVSSDYPNFGDCVDKPEGLNRMIEISNILAADFPFVRVDLYNINTDIIFGELTFYPWTGYVTFNPDTFDYLLGEDFILPSKFE